MIDEMWILISLLIHAIIFQIVYGGLPVSYPGLGIQYPMEVPYNLIDTNPSCYLRGFCPMFPPGGKLSAFPNSEEKYQMILHNLWRMWGNETRGLKYGKYKWGFNTGAGLTQYCTNCRYCGDTNPDTRPLYWYSDANQAARFKQYDENSCNQAWYREPGQTAHSTCNWVLPEFGGGSNCDVFGGCDMTSRARSFCHEDNSWPETEGICGGNTCVTDDHCEPIFAPKYDYQGAGFVEGMNGAATTYIRRTKQTTYLLPMAAHFDERLRVADADKNANRMYFTLMLQYFDANHTQTPRNCWSLARRGYQEMNVTVSEVGSLETGFSRDSYSVMFTAVYKPPQSCKPYAFICETSLGNYVRLPEDGDYYFGTEWIDWEWSEYASYHRDKHVGYTCKENHYYNDGTQWIVNGGPTLNKCDIWHYQNTEEEHRSAGNHTHRTTCNGCNELNQLDCWSECIYSGFAPESCEPCETLEPGPDYGNEWCDPEHTTAPIHTAPSVDPTERPVEFPSVPTESSSEIPSQSATPVPITIAPSAGPTELSSDLPSESPSTGPTDFVDVCCDCLVDTAPTLSQTQISGCAADSACEEYVCGNDAECCSLGWGAQCVSIASNKCFGTTNRTPAPVERRPNNRTPRPTRRRRPPIFH